MLILGADEFAPDRPTQTTQPEPSRPSVSPDVVRQIYAVPTFSTVGYASPAASRWFADTLPPGFVRVDTVTTRTLTVGGLSVTVILFPQVTDTVPAKLLDSIVQIARQANADLVIGVSPWGFQPEARALPQLAGAVDVLLGAGEGAPFTVEQTGFAPSVLWSRADRDGRCVVELQFTTLPDRKTFRPLLRDVDYTAREYPLGMAVPADPTVEALLPLK